MRIQSTNAKFEQLSSKDKKSTFKRLFRIIWAEHKLSLLLVGFLIILSTSGMLYNQVFIGQIIYQGLLVKVNDAADRTSAFDYQKFQLIIFGSATLFLVAVLSGFAANRIMINVTYKVITKLRNDLYKHVQNLAVQTFDGTAKGKLLAHFTSDIDTLKQFLSKSFPSMIQSSIVIFVAVIVMFVFSWILALIMLVSVIFIFLSAYFIGKQSSKAFRNKQQKIGEITGFADENIAGLKTIKMFNQENDAIQQYQNHNAELAKQNFRSEFFSNIIFPVAQNIGNIAYAIVVLVGALITIYVSPTAQANLWSIIGLTIGTIISFTQFAKSFSGPISTMTQNANIIILALAGTKRVFDLLDVPVEIDEGKIKLVKVEEANNHYIEIPMSENYGKYAWKFPKSSDRKCQYKFVEGKIEFRNVWFKYQDHWTLRDISFIANAGEKVALVGATGAGKTTIVNLITRFYEVSKGDIFYDDINIKDIEKASLRKSIGYILQEAHLFTDTVKNNIIYGTEGIDDYLLKNVTEAANLNTHINKMQDEYETILVNSGSNLSQGQKQLVAIARANYKNPPVLILDEATSNIDTHTEHIVNNAMNRLIENRTSFIIAHRLSTIVHADKILVLKEGEIIENGSHDELMNSKGAYWKLWENNKQK
ncbi:ABC transporter ATP-binding protein [Mycoplasma sp. Pen4]|uniref:ABC transporter ATP-binding protein n=1 Tax=Mycoplasma sp. Pen4 TaxID=640330 RepID=UPI0016543A8A|nr:ABC transporter ATP-binding protein [Mycoplasma sp. Pen4]QNM93879.1 ABC transporter ATP-binding protein [Mycoplasma sp. Pen4]